MALFELAKNRVKPINFLSLRLFAVYRYYFVINNNFLPF